MTRPAALPRFAVFGGKGGVGKTTCAAARAVAAAAGGARVLVVSIDPAHSLGDALDRRLGPEPLRVATRGGRLHALELDADAAVARWLRPRRAALGRLLERGTYLDRQDIAGLLKQAVPGVDELAAFLELLEWAAGDFDLVVVDTAPTGHTLRWLAMPGTARRAAEALATLGDRDRVLAATFGGRYRPDAGDLLVDTLRADAQRVAALLRDPARSAFHWVTLAEEMAIAETADALAALERDGLPVAAFIINRLTAPPPGRCDFCARRRRGEAAAVRAVRDLAGARAVWLLEERPVEPRGLQELAALGMALGRGGSARLARASRTLPSAGPVRRGMATVPPLPLTAEHRLLFFAGKGGVGKTTCAAAAAMALARRRPAARILLLSADPAHSLGDVLGEPIGERERAVAGAPAGMRVRELNAERTFRRWRDTAGPALDALAIDGGSEGGWQLRGVSGLLELVPPGIDEILALLTVVEALFPDHAGTRDNHEDTKDTIGSDGGDAKRRKSSGSGYDLIVVDAAPTGHALRLLAWPAAAQSWTHALLRILLKYRDATGLGRLAGELTRLAQSLRRLRALIADPARTAVVAVTRAAALPVRETGRLLDGLDRLQLCCPAVLVNGLTPGTCARCRRGRREEERWMEQLGLRARAGRTRLVAAPATAPPPRGVRALEAWIESWEERGRSAAGRRPPRR